MKKNLVKKAVLPALIALLCSVVALTSVSYAWFSMGNQASVEGVEMNVTSAGGLQISATGNATDFKSTLNVSDLKGATGNNFPETAVVPVSTSGAVSNGSLSFFTGQIENGVLGTVSASTSYICFDIYVKVNVANKLHLEKGSTVTCADKDTELATRVAFINLGYASTAADAIAMTDGKFTASNAIKIWEPNSTTRSQAYLNAGGTEDNKKLDYNGIADTSKKEEKVTTFDFNTSDESVELCSLNEGYNRIRVYIWLEGQDVDCLNEISGGKLSVNLKFKQPENK